MWKHLKLEEGKEWIWKVDNTVALAYAKKGGGRVEGSARWTEILWWEMVQKEVKIVGLECG